MVLLGFTRYSAKGDIRKYRTLFAYVVDLQEKVDRMYGGEHDFMYKEDRNADAKCWTKFKFLLPPSCLLQHKEPLLHGLLSALPNGATRYQQHKVARKYVKEHWRVNHTMVG